MTTSNLSAHRWDGQTGSDSLGEVGSFIGRLRRAIDARSLAQLRKRHASIDAALGLRLKIDF
jgi:hypothetical protein